MSEYIDKAALVAKIERLISNGQTKLKESEERKDYESYVALAERIATCINVLSFLDTLEVKEVGLEKELNKLDSTLYDMDGVAIDDNTDSSETRYITVEDVKDIARHFFELGLKAQKGE